MKRINRIGPSSTDDRRVINEELKKTTVCKICTNSNVELQNESRIGLGEAWTAVCLNKECDSHVLTKSFHSTPKNVNGRFYDVNRAFVLALRVIGRGYSAAEKLNSVLNIQHPVYKTPWSEHTKALEKAAQELLEEELSNASLEVKRLKVDNGDLTLKEDEELSSCIADTGVSVDGSWSSRGWTARDGIMAVVSIDKGKVLDVCYLSNSCTLCGQKERERLDGKISRVDFLQWTIDHEPQCYLTHEGSSQVSLETICLTIVL